MSTVRWISPIRRDGLRELSPIPNEIYLEILGYFKPSKSLSGWSSPDLHNLARVCRFFFSIALPWIFEWLCLEIGEDKTDSAGQENLTKFCRRLLNGEEAAQTAARFVKKCNLELAPSTEIGWALQELLSMYFKAIAQMPNIEEIVLWGMIITKDTLKSLARLERLKTLRIMSCHLAQDVKEKHLAKISTLRLSSLDILLFPNNIGLVMDQSTRSVVPLLEEINWSCITSLKLMATEIAPTIEVAWVTSKSLSLVELDLSCIEMTLPLHLLARTPSLRVLRLTKVSYPHQAPLDSSTVPMLEELRAPLPVCTMLVPGRPVANLGLVNIGLQETPGLAEALIFQTASRPISQLSVPVQFYLNVPFWRHFPSLRVLHLDVITYAREQLPTIKVPIHQTISNIAEAWPRHPYLHTLTFESGRFWKDKQFLDLEQQHSWIKNNLMPKFPALRTCYFSQGIEWHYDEANAFWKPTIPDSRVDMVRELLQRVGRDYFVDFNNCLQEVLFPASP